MLGKRGSVQLLVIAIVLLAVCLAGCSDDEKIISEPPDGHGPTEELTGCLSCHGDADYLAANVEDEGGSGEGSGEG